MAHHQLHGSTWVPLEALPWASWASTSLLWAPWRRGHHRAPGGTAQQSHGFGEEVSEVLEVRATIFVVDPVAAFRLIGIGHFGTVTIVAKVMFLVGCA